MTFELFLASLSQAIPPADLSVYHKALWYDARNNWEKAHELIQDVPDSDAYWIHAYLHRKEGDTWNADYWYRKAGKKRPSGSLEDEWRHIAGTLFS